MDKTKLRPIGLGLTLRCFISSHIARYYVDEFKAYSNPHQYGIGTSNIMEFTTNACTVWTQQYITRFLEEIPTNPPTRVLISLDLKNMFNACNRKQLVLLVQKHFPVLYSYFHLSYEDPNIIFFHQGDTGIWPRILQEDNCTQGDPLRVFFASAVFHKILEPLDKQLRHRAKHRTKQSATSPIMMMNYLLSCYHH